MGLFMHGCMGWDTGQLGQWFASFERLQDRLQDKDSGNAQMLSKHFQRHNFCGTTLVTILGVRETFDVSQKFGVWRAERKF